MPTIIIIYTQPPLPPLPPHPPLLPPPHPLLHCPRQDPLLNLEVCNLLDASQEVSDECTLNSLP